MVDTENALVTRSFNSFYHTVNTNYMIRKSFQSKTASDTKKFTPLAYD